MLGLIYDVILIVVNHMLVLENMETAKLTSTSLPFPLQIRFQMMLVRN